MHDKISVIIPVYNVEKYIDRCLTSIVKQSYDNLEIILVDDGSTDGSGEICDRYAKDYDNIKVHVWCNMRRCQVRQSTQFLGEV